jgi:hypothetical protein
MRTANTSSSASFGYEDRPKIEQESIPSWTQVVSGSRSMKKSFKLIKIAKIVGITWVGEKQY